MAILGELEAQKSVDRAVRVPAFELLQEVRNSSDLSRWKALYREYASMPGVRGQLATFESEAGQQMEVGRVSSPIRGACFGEMSP